MDKTANCLEIEQASVGFLECVLSTGALNAQSSTSRCKSMQGIRDNWREMVGRELRSRECVWTEQRSPPLLT